jgi:hypothetical protein
MIVLGFRTISHVMLFQFLCVVLLISEKACAWISVSRNPHRPYCNQIPLYGAASLTDLLDTLDDQRNFPALQNWALDRGVVLADGVKLVDNGLGDWGVGLSENHTQVAQTPIMTIPKDLVLSSADPKLQELRNTISESMASVSMEYYVPECLLMMLVLWEKAKANASAWSPWLETLPKGFNTGIHLDPLERSHVERVAPEFLLQQDLQWTACHQALQYTADNNLLPMELQEFLCNAEDDMDDLTKWAFSIIFTRSWRTPSGSEATLVPLGDMFNHDSAMANVAPNILEDGSVQMTLKQDVSEGSPLFLSYGMGVFPARFLVNFGFWDRSAQFMDANLTIPEEFPVDRSQLVASTRTGGITEDVWNLAIYRLLQERDPAMAEKLAVAQQKQDEASIQDICSKFDLEGALYLRLHALTLLSETYPDMDIAPENLSESPRRFGMIARYNNGMRESWMRVAEYLDEEIDDALRRRK